MRVSSTFATDITGAVVAKRNIPLAARKPRVTSEDVADPGRLAEMLTRMRETQDEVTYGFRSSPFASTILFQDVAVSTAGATVSLRHGLGRRAFWIVVDWQASTPGNAPNIQTNTSSDTSTLILQSYTAGTASVLVF